jgi:hypothetical protein
VFQERFHEFVKTCSPFCLWVIRIAIPNTSTGLSVEEVNVFFLFSLQESVL